MFPAKPEDYVGWPQDLPTGYTDVWIDGMTVGGGKDVRVRIEFKIRLNGEREFKFCGKGCDKEGIWNNATLMAAKDVDMQWKAIFGEENSIEELVFKRCKPRISANVPPFLGGMIALPIIEPNKNEYQ